MNVNKISGIYSNKLLKKGLQKKSVAHNTVCPDKLEKMIKKHESRKEEKEKLIN